MSDLFKQGDRVLMVERTHSQYGRVGIISPPEIYSACGRGDSRRDFTVKDASTGDVWGVAVPGRYLQKVEPVSSNGVNAAYPSIRRRPKVYVAGPITGQVNYQARFAETASKLDSMGFDTYNPATLEDRDDWEWADYMKHHIPELLKCDGICMVENYHLSPGAKLERNLATDLGLFEVQLNG